MDIDTRLLSTAERLFDHDGFQATGMGRLVAATGLSSRTVYKHVGSKNTLMARVLAARRARFFALARFDDVDALFDGLKTWFETEGARGCLFFRLRAETGGRIPEIEAAVADYQTRLTAGIAELVTRTTGTPNARLTDQLLVLFEGATTAASYRGTAAVEAARDAALHLVTEAIRIS